MGVCVRGGGVGDYLVPTTARFTYAQACPPSLPAWPQTHLGASSMTHSQTIFRAIHRVGIAWPMVGRGQWQQHRGGVGCAAATAGEVALTRRVPRRVGAGTRKRRRSTSCILNTYKFTISDGSPGQEEGPGKGGPHEDGRPSANCRAHGEVECAAPNHRQEKTRWVAQGQGVVVPATRSHARA
jgi:hypothetical protein